MQPSSDSFFRDLAGLLSHKLLEMSTELEQEGKNLEENVQKKKTSIPFSVCCVIHNRLTKPFILQKIKSSTLGRADQEYLISASAY